MASVAAQVTTAASSGQAGCANSAGQHLRVATWNIAAINNNPFEYWITHEDAAYNELMHNVQEFITSPGERDVAVSEVFTETMFQELKAALASHGLTGLDETEAKWNAEYKDRKIISGFMQDPEIGSKRLASMPDRVTNTVNLADGTAAHRPTAINSFDGDFSSFQDWWAQWKRFMFEDELAVKPGRPSVRGMDLLVPITRAKYPAVTEEEEALSLPLQALCGAIFDAILIHMLNQVSPTWQALRHELSHALNRNKNERTLEILEKTYADLDVLFLQEVANAFVSKMAANPGLAARFHAVVPETSGKRDQNSIVLLRKDRFDVASVRDVTPLVLKHFEGKKVPVAEGDLVAFTVQQAVGDGEPQSLLLASFHGDTNGLATIPVVQGVLDVAQADLEGKHRLIFGLDANTYEKGKPGKTQDVTEFASFYVERGLTSCWGNAPDPKEYTTFNARTYLQPQLNKAATKDEFLAKGDVNPKDFVLFSPEHFAVVGAPLKDNTGERAFVADMAFPTLKFPSDHAVLSVTLQSQL